MHTVPATINMGLYVHLLLCLIYLPIYLYYLIFKNISLSLSVLCMYTHATHMCVGTHRGQKRLAHPLELELQAVVSDLGARN